MYPIFFFEYRVTVSNCFTDLVVTRLQDEVCQVAIAVHSALCSVTMLRSRNWTLSLHWATTFWLKREVPEENLRQKFISQLRITILTVFSLKETEY